MKEKSKDIQALQDAFYEPNAFAKDCPSRAILMHVCSRWGGLVLIALQGNTLRFSELRRKISGISEKMLSQTLQTLTDDGFILRTSYPVIPPYVEYQLTPMGQEVTEHLGNLVIWIESNLERILDTSTGQTSTSKTIAKETIAEKTTRQADSAA